MTKDSRFQILLPVTITDKDRQQILEKVDDLNNSSLGAYLDPDLLIPIDEVSPETIQYHQEIFDAFSKPDLEPILTELIRNYRFT